MTTPNPEPSSAQTRAAPPAPPVETLATTAPLPHDPFLNPDPTPISVTVEGYGGIRVDKCEAPGEAGARLLQFCVDNLKVVDATLTQYGVLVAKYGPDDEFDLAFSIRRPDGWVLAVPEAKTRKQGMIQLIQALHELQANRTTAALLQNAGITAYKY